jgi:hypothetical protein
MSLELFTFSDPEILAARLAGAERRIDHVAYRVADLDALAATLRGSGARFCGPDRREETVEPLALGGSRHLWTVPESAGGLAVQLIGPAR